jgi:hypothetical protein
MDVTIRQRIAVLGAGMHLTDVMDRAPDKRLGQRLAYRRRGIGVLLGETAVELSAQPRRQTVRGIVSLGNQLCAVQTCPGDKPLRIGGGDADHMASAHAIAD